MIEFSELRGPNKIFGSFCKINEPNILFGPLISENSIVTPPLVKLVGSKMRWTCPKSYQASFEFAEHIQKSLGFQFFKKTC